MLERDREINSHFNQLALQEKQLGYTGHSKAPIISVDEVAELSALGAYVDQSFTLHL